MTEEQAITLHGMAKDLAKDLIAIGEKSQAALDFVMATGPTEPVATSIVQGALAAAMADLTK